MMPSLTHRKHASEPINQLKSFVQKTRWGLFARQKKNCWFCLNIRSKLKYASKKYISSSFLFTQNWPFSMKKKKKREENSTNPHTKIRILHETSASKWHFFLLQFCIARWFLLHKHTHIKLWSFIDLIGCGCEFIFVYIFIETHILRFARTLAALTFKWLFIYYIDSFILAYSYRFSIKSRVFFLFFICRSRVKWKLRDPTAHELRDAVWHKVYTTTK